VGADWTPGAGDVKISKDGGAAANVTNLPSAIAMGNSTIWDFSLTATEMQAAQVMVTVADSATKAVDDTGFIIETYGNASANLVFDLSQANPKVDVETIKTQTVTAGAGVTILASVGTAATSTAQTGDGYARLGAPAGASVSADVAAVKAVLPAALVSGRIDASVGAMAANVLTATAINADAITDAKVAADVTIASVTGAVGSVTGAVGSVTGAVGSVTGAVGSVTGNIGGNVTGSVGSLAAQAKADVNAEVVDGLNTDTYAEPAQGAPAATASIVTKVGFLYKSWRNKTTQTATTYALLNDDAVTVDHKATVGDDGTTFTRGEVAAGP
jgi:hypothetical protein